MFGRGARASILSEPGALAADLPCGSVRAVPLRRGPMAVHTIGIGLGDVLLQSGRSTPAALLGTLSRATVLLVLPLDGREAMALNGRAVQPRCLAAFGAGAGYEAASTRDCAWAAVVLDAATAGVLLGRRSLPLALRPGAHALLRASPGAWARAEALARDASEAAAQNPRPPWRMASGTSAASRASTSSGCQTTTRSSARVEAAVGALMFGWSTAPIAARLGMTKALSRGSIYGCVEAMRSSGACSG